MEQTVEKKEAHILELIKTKEIRDIIRIYPDMNSKKITFLVSMDMMKRREKVNYSM